MELTSVVQKLRDRVRKFLDINNKVELVELRLHLECPGTDLLLALGQLIYKNEVEVNREGWKIIIIRKNLPDGKK